MKKTGSPVEIITNDSGTRLALTRTLAGISSSATTGQKQNLGPVLLAHGTFSNHRSMRGMAQHLADTGFDCWSLDFQGHGHSDKPTIDPSFDSMSIEDAAAALDHLKALYPSQAIVWIGHSGGGLAVLTLLCRQPEYKAAIKAIVSLASQATHAATLNKHRIAIQLSSVITRLMGYAPGKFFKLGPENEFGPVMAQWYRWSLTGQWLGDDGFNYMDALPTITTPALMLSGSGDEFIAPPQGCRALFDQLGSPDKQYQECGLQTGFAENYNHSRLLSSRSASREVWPLVANWLAAR
ncbi:MAG: alpha/beta fold hydrolase [Granulosicoccaceae bacterium]